MRNVYTITIALIMALAPSMYAQDVEEAVDALAAKYVEGWNAGDAAMCASIYTENGDSVDLAGQRFEGRAAIEQSIAQTLEVYSGSTIKIERTTLHQVNDDLVVSDGIWEVMGASAAEGVPTSGFYTIIAVRDGDTWLIEAGRAKAAPPAQ